MRLGRQDLEADQVIRMAPSLSQDNTLLDCSNADSLSLGYELEATTPNRRDEEPEDVSDGLEDTDPRSFTQYHEPSNSSFATPRLGEASLAPRLPSSSPRSLNQSFEAAPIDAHQPYTET